jgi:predicted transcriptional regulator
MRDTAPQGTYKVQALDRAFAVLDLLGESETPLGLAQVAASLQLHKSTAHRFLMVLERHRMVERTTNGKFRLGLRLFDFGNRAIEQYDLRDRAQPHLRRLVAETEETAHLCIMEAARMIYIDKIEPARSVRMITRVGASNPVHCTSVGKAILAFLQRIGPPKCCVAPASSASRIGPLPPLMPCARRWKRRAAADTPWMTRSLRKGCAALPCRFSMRNGFPWRR